MAFGKYIYLFLGIGKTKVPDGPYSLALTSPQETTHSKDYSDESFKNHQEDIYSEDCKDFPDQNDLPEHYYYYYYDESGIDISNELENKI